MEVRALSSQQNIANVIGTHSTKGHEGQSYNQGINQPVSEKINEQSLLNKKISDIVKQETKDNIDQNKLDKKQIEDLIKEIMSEIEFLKNKITFKVEPKYDNSWIVLVINRETEDVIRQFPPEYLLKINKSMKEMIKGILLDEKT